jgi:acyl-CoA reductase-like NAD-dependent aldehyde dehydrogenase
MRDTYPFYLAGQPATGDSWLDVTDKYNGEVVARVAMGDRNAIDGAISAAAGAAAAMRKMPAFARQEALRRVVSELRARHEEFARVMCMEAGKPIRDARSEVTRAIDTFAIASEEATRIYGEYLPLDISQRAQGFEAIAKRVPVGPCSFITPFNFPLNLVAHKVAPAIAAGCPFVLKPAPQTPITAILLGEILAQCELPPGAFSVVPCTVGDAAPLVEDDRIKLLSFTGSAEVGWKLKSSAGKKKVVLELGGNAVCIVDGNADVQAAVPRIIFGAFYQSGQSCISVQRLMIHDDVYEQLKRPLVFEAAKLKWGDPRNESTFLGPLISEKDAIRIDDWVNEARRAGARVLCGGKRHGLFYEATILENVAATTKLRCQEAFGPVLTIEPFSQFEAACAAANNTRYGLQAGVFTRDIAHTMHAWNTLEVGGVVINDVPSMRVDSMPYGGVKDSGLGREGVRYAMHEMTELRLMVLKNVGW